MLKESFAAAKVFPLNLSFQPFVMELKEKSKVAFSLVGTEGFEPPISCSHNTRLSQAGLRPVRNLCGASRSIEGSLGNLPRLQSVVSALPDYTYEAVFEHRQRQ